MMFDFRGDGWGPTLTFKNRTLEGRWPGGVKNRQKLSNVIYGRPLTVNKIWE